MFDCKVSLTITKSLNAHTRAAYSSALNSYLTFCHCHKFPIEPTIQMLTFYTVYMCNYIKPSSVDSYLSGIVSELEPFYPKFHTNQLSPSIRSVLAGMKRVKGINWRQARALTTDDLRVLATALGTSHTHNGLLFLSQILTGVHNLPRAGELTQLDKADLRNPRYNSLWSSAIWKPTAFGFDLTTSKTSKTYKGHKFLIMQCTLGPNPLTFFSKYI